MIPAMKKAKEREKARRSASGSSANPGHLGAPQDPSPAVIELLEEVSRAIEQASGSVLPDGGAQADPRRVPSRFSGPCGPAPVMPGSSSVLADPVLLDRYQGLLVRSGVVGAAVHHLPSRTRQRLDEVLRELIAGVARGRPADGVRVEALVADLVATIGERIVCSVDDWRDTPQ